MLVINRTLAFLFLGASLPVIAGLFSKAGTQQPVRWNTGGSVSTTTYSELESFLADGKVTDRALQDAIRMFGWTAEELRFDLNKTYAVDLPVCPGSFIPTPVKPFWRIKQGLVSLIGAKRRRRPRLCGPPSSRMPRMGSLALSAS
ncbi:hypothetical protein [Parasynechococcus sp.]|uniref:hypothetical protein n=1 Tax=Parasynechococcus sp. TaxID=3101203 RepID=UPI003704B1A0